ncbi:Phosphatidylinositol phosphate phosphatase [Cryptosporidium felis]|nr:Phosphatidylinositol phosphate phosphatase [Cryptosporidium felis]
MGCLKTRWRCIHNGECSKEFYYRIHTFVGGLEIVLEDTDKRLSGSGLSLSEEKTVTFPRLVIIRPKELGRLNSLLSKSKRVSEYRKSRLLNELVDSYEKEHSQALNYETRQLCEFSANCIFEINSEKDLGLLKELRSLYGLPEFLNRENNIDSNLMGSILEKDESGILVVNPWETSPANLSNDEGQWRRETGELSRRSETAEIDSGLGSRMESSESGRVLDFSGFSTASLEAFAIFGIIFIFEEPFLLVSTGKEKSSIIYQNGRYKTVNRVTKSAAIPLLSNPIENQFLRVEEKFFNQVRLDAPGINSNNLDHRLPREDLRNNRGRENSGRSNEKTEWINRVSSSLQRISPIKGTRESLSLLGESGAQWLSNSIINVSSGILSSVSTAFSSSVSSGQTSSDGPVKDSPPNPNDLQSASKDTDTPLSLEELLAERKSCLERLVEGVTKMISSGGFFYSFDFDLTRTLQKKFENRQKDFSEKVGASGEHGETPSELKSKALIISGDPRFIWNRTISLPILISGVDPRWVTPLIQGYFCNQAIVISPEGPGYVKIGSDILSLRMNLINSFADFSNDLSLSPYSHPNNGNLSSGQSHADDNACRYRFACKMCYRDHLDSLTRYDIVLMSRRSWERGGTRFNARGVDEDGNVANFVESELQICINNSDHWFAFTQIRGSVPLFWEQTGVNSCALTCFDRDFSSFVFGKHHQRLVEMYGEVFYVNLLGSSTHEQALSSGLKEEINHYNSNINCKISQIRYSEDSDTGLVCSCLAEGGTEKNPYCFCSCKGIPIVYSSYDFHHNAKSQGFENALNEYVSILAKEFGERVGYFHGIYVEFGSEDDDHLQSSETGTGTVTEPASFANLLNLEDFDIGDQGPSPGSLPVRKSCKEEFVIRQRQKGVLRTNCLDCLDRTNALQWYVAWTWFVDLIFSIATSSIESGIDQSLEGDGTEEVSQEVFMKSLFNSQLTHFGWFSVDFSNKNTSSRREKMGNWVAVGDESSGMDSSGSRNLDCRRVEYSPLSLANPIVSSRMLRDNFEPRGSPKNSGLKSLGQRHSFLVKRALRSNVPGLGTTDFSSPSISSEVASRDCSILDLERLRSRHSRHFQGRTGCSAFGKFKSCLLNGMGAVTLKDSFSLLWAENGDVISELYTGAGSVFSGVIKNRKVSLSTNFDHALKSLRRLYHNAFEDSSRQQYIDCLLYKHPSNSSIRLGHARNLLRERVSSCQVNTPNGRGPLGVPEPVQGFEPREFKFLPQSEKLTIWVGSWNLGGQPLRVTLDSWFRSSLTEKNNPSIVCFCLQEMVELSSVRAMFNQSDKSKEATFEMLALQALGTNKYQKLHSTTLVGLYSVVFVRKSLSHFIKSVETSSLKLGLLGNTGNKGAIMVRINIEGFGSIVVTNVHLISGEQYKDERISQLKTILQTPLFAEVPNFNWLLKSGPALVDHDLVILAGDFNFRLQLPRQRVSELIQSQKLDDLLSFDQFLIETSSKAGSDSISGTANENVAEEKTGLETKTAKTDSNPGVLSRLKEAKISFFPTYKFIRGEYNYDQSRTPSWCDRILVFSRDLRTGSYRGPELPPRRVDSLPGSPPLSSSNFTITNYTSNPRYLISDHHPISAIVTLEFQYQSE